MKSAKFKTIDDALRHTRRYRRVKGKCDLTKKPWINGPKANVQNRKAQAYTGVKIFPSLLES